MSEGSGGLPGGESVTRAVNWLRRMTTLILTTASQIETLTKQNAQLAEEVRTLRIEVTRLEGAIERTAIEMRAETRVQASESANRALIPLVERVVKAEAKIDRLSGPSDQSA